MDRLPHPLIHLILPRIPREGIDALPQRERGIGPKKQPPRPYKLQQQIELVLVTAQSGVVVELLGILRHLLARVGGQAGVREGGGDTGDEVGEVDGGAAGFGAVVEYWLVESAVGNFLNCEISVPSGGAGLRDWYPPCASGGRTQPPDASPTPPRAGGDRDVRGSGCRCRNGNTALYHPLSMPSVSIEFLRQRRACLRKGRGSR